MDTDNELKSDNTLTSAQKDDQEPSQIVNNQMTDDVNMELRSQKSSCSAEVIEENDDDDQINMDDSMETEEPEPVQPKFFIDSPPVSQEMSSDDSHSSHEFNSLLPICPHCPVVLQYVCPNCGFCDGNHH
jgi:hypothetical protein